MGGAGRGRSGAWPGCREVLAGVASRSSWFAVNGAHTAASASLYRLLEAVTTGHPSQISP